MKKTSNIHLKDSFQLIIDDPYQNTALSKEEENKLSEWYTRKLISNKNNSITTFYTKDSK